MAPISSRAIDVMIVTSIHVDVSIGYLSHHRFADRERVRLPLLAEDLSEVESLRKVGTLLHGTSAVV